VDLVDGRWEILTSFSCFLQVTVNPHSGETENGGLHHDDKFFQGTLIAGMGLSQACTCSIERKMRMREERNFLKSGE
jgi:hypothetical protein